MRQALSTGCVKEPYETLGTTAGKLSSGKLQDVGTEDKVEEVRPSITSELSTLFRKLSMEHKVAETTMWTLGKEDLMLRDPSPVTNNKEQDSEGVEGAKDYQLVEGRTARLHPCAFR